MRSTPSARISRRAIVLVRHDLLAQGDGTSRATYGIRVQIAQLESSVPTWRAYGSTRGS